MFIDATYEGDLMALAGIGYTVGREPNSMYGEELNGIVESQHQFGIPGIDPYLERGKPESGLLPWVQPGLGGNYGDGDKKIMAYCFRMCLTNVPDNRVMIEKPEGYDESEYELLFRAFEKGFPAHACFQLSRIPNQKTDSNMGSGHSTNHIGANWNYPEADYETRETIRQAHEIYQRGYVWTVQNHPRVPEKVRNTLKTWGLAKDEFTDTNNWPPQLYVRESRRMVSDYVVSEQEIFQKKLPAKPVGLASYNVDSHPVQYCVGENGLVRTEGGTLRTPPKAYQLDYGVIVPKKRECDNLLVSVCVSASHSAYSSLRMEPVYMILGQSAAVAAAEAIDKKLAVQDIAYADLRKRLLDVGQILEDNDDKPFAMDDGGNPQWK